MNKEKKKMTFVTALKNLRDRVWRRKKNKKENKKRKSQNK